MSDDGQDSAGERTFESADQAPLGKGEIALGKHIRIDLNKPLPQYSRRHAPAYAASDARSPGQLRYAVITSETLPPRLAVLPSLARIDDIPAAMPMDWGRVAWGEEGERRFAIVFAQPNGPPLANDPQAQVEQMREDRIVEKVIQPIYKTLAEFYSRVVTHRAFCLTNIFVDESKGGEFNLGECVSTPPGMVQPTLFETIPGGQANEIGRGAGVIKDDLYALGVLIALLLRGGNPMRNWSTSEMIAAKIEKGSYATIMGRTRVSLKLMEPLRGLLCDEPGERWNLENLEMWLSGRQLSPKQASLPEKARRAYEFRGDGYWNTRSLGHAMAENWRDALPVAGGGEIERWAGRSLPNEIQARNIATAGAGGGDRGLARLLIALDPSAPIRVRGFATKIQAIPQALALGYDDEVVRARITEMINAKLPSRWLELQPAEGGESIQNIPPFDRMGFYLERRSLGNGVERCIYEFNAEWPCLSPFVRGKFVINLRQLLPAMEAYAEKTTPTSEPVDRHIVAFAAARLERLPDKILQGLAKSGDDVTRYRALMHLLARVQRYYGPDKVPNLCGWVHPFARRIVDSLHNVKTKEKLHKQLNRGVEAGSLPDMLAAIDDPETRQEDAHGFEAAQREYAANLREISWLEGGGLNSPENIAQATRGWATAISALLSGLVVMLVTIFYVT